MSSGRRIHRLYQVDFSDPNVPPVPKMEAIVELYYCFDFRESVIGYFPGMPGELFFDADYEFTSDHESFPFEDYPTEFPRVPVRVDAVDYDPKNLEDALAFAGVFGIGELAPAKYKKAMALQREFYEMAMNEPAASDKDVLASFCAPLLQECPSWSCLNPECRSYKSKASVVPFCVVSNSPVNGVCLFGQLADVQVIFEVCCECGMILASNQAG